MNKNAIEIMNKWIVFSHEKNQRKLNTIGKMDAVNCIEREQETFMKRVN